MAECGYSDKLVRQQIFKACRRKRQNLLDNMIKKVMIISKVFNIAYQPNCYNLKNTISFLHLLHTPDGKYEKAFHKVWKIFL